VKGKAKKDENSTFSGVDSDADRPKISAKKEEEVKPVVASNGEKTE
jgi:hypothetical protein